ncbi:MAG TPA: hypothetical protein PK580_00245 [Nitrosomonas halophila]|nr:hypothetical protein [Nitrosomonas halophila]
MDNMEFLNDITLLANHFYEAFFLAIGAIIALVVMYLREYRLSQYTSNGYFWYLFEADRKKTDDVLVILFTLIVGAIVTGALTGLSPSQLITTGIGLGVATKVRAGDNGKERA